MVECVGAEDPGDVMFRVGEGFEEGREEGGGCGWAPMFHGRRRRGCVMCRRSGRGALEVVVKSDIEGRALVIY